MSKTELAITNIPLLERQLRKWKAFALTVTALLLALLSVGFMQAQRMPADSIRAERFVLQDERGHVRARMWVGPKGPALEFYDDQGRVIWSAPPQPRVRPVEP